MRRKDLLLPNGILLGESLDKSYSTYLSRVLADFAEEQRVGARSFRTVRTTACFRQESFIVFGERDRLAAEVHVLFNPRLQLAWGTNRWRQPRCIFMRTYV